MNTEQLSKANELMKRIEELSADSEVAQNRADRVSAYIEFMDGRVPPRSFANKVYKKVNVKFNIEENPTRTNVNDYFDIAEENKKDFVDFLKASQQNYLKRIKSNSKEIEKLNKEFEEL